MYYSKTDNIIYISNPIEKLFIEKEYVDHITKNGTIRYDFLGNWTMVQQYIELGENKFMLPVKLVNNTTSFVLDINQVLVASIHDNFKLLANVIQGVVPYNATFTKPNYLIRPNAFFTLLRIVQTWSNVDIIDVNNFFLSQAAKTEEVRLLHCKLIYHQSQRITL